MVYVVYNIFAMHTSHFWSNSKQIPFYELHVCEKNPALCGRRGIFTPSMVRLSVDNVDIVEVVPWAICLSTCSALVTNLISELLSYTRLSVYYTSFGLINMSSKIVH